MSKLGAELLWQLGADTRYFDPIYMKVILERLLSLDFKDSVEAQTFFYQVRNLSKQKANEVKKELSEIEGGKEEEAKNGAAEAQAETNKDSL